MKGIKLFFDKFNNKATQEIQNRNTVSKVIKQFTGQEIPIENISFNNRTIKVITSSELKSEIFINKKKILNSILKESSQIKALDIT